MAIYTWKSSMNNNSSLIELNPQEESGLINQGFQYKVVVPAGTPLKGWFEKDSSDAVMGITNFELPIGNIDLDSFNKQEINPISSGECYTSIGEKLFSLQEGNQLEEFSQIRLQRKDFVGEDYIYTEDTSKTYAAWTGTWHDLDNIESLSFTLSNNNEIFIEPLLWKSATLSCGSGMLIDIKNKLNYTISNEGKKITLQGLKGTNPSPGDFLFTLSKNTMINKDGKVAIICDPLLSPYLYDASVEVYWYDENGDIPSHVINNKSESVVKKVITENDKDIVVFDFDYDNVMAMVGNNEYGEVNFVDYPEVNGYNYNIQLYGYNQEKSTVTIPLLTEFTLNNVKNTIITSDYKDEIIKYTELTNKRTELKHKNIVFPEDEKVVIPVYLESYLKGYEITLSKRNNNILLKINKRGRRVRTYEYHNSDFNVAMQYEPPIRAFVSDMEDEFKYKDLTLTLEDDLVIYLGNE